MAKKTLLQMTQNILNAMDSDEVNSISDTVESLQVAEIIRETYEDLVATLSIPERRALTQLDGMADPTRPNYMMVPTTVKDVIWIRYNGNEITYKDPEDFIETALQAASPIITVTDYGGATYPVVTNSDPKYYTSFDDNHVAFNSVNLSSDSSLQSSKSIIWANMNREFLLEDSFIADLDDNFFPTLLADAKQTCFINLKQVANANEENRAKRGLMRIQNELNRMATRNPIDRLPNYGRRR